MARALIQRVITRRANLRYLFPPDFAQRLEGQIVLAVRRRAKYLLAELASGDVLLMHLGMSGSFRVAVGDAEYDPHDHVIFEISTGALVIFNDPRRFGFMTLLRGGEVESHRALARLGPEPLAPRFGASALARELGRRRTPLKLALSDQRVIAGLGNIYVSEALYRARLSPRRRASTLVTRTGEPRPALDDLVEAIKDVLRAAIRNQYAASVVSGFSRKNPFLVYDREGERCPRRGCGGTIKRIVQGGRSTFYCPVCQR
jgi:formamidopyrimidine-DNA glycosylase